MRVTQIDTLNYLLRLQRIYFILGLGGLVFFLIMFTTTEQTNSFMNGPFKHNINFSLPQLFRNESLPNCSHFFSRKFNNRSSIYNISIPSDVPSYSTLEQRHRQQLQQGGHFFPSHCRPQQRVAIIVCHRNRETHLRLFLDYLHPFLQEQLLDYVIFVVHQHDRLPFNRGALFNIGFIEAQKHYSFDCFIFHDVDLIPEDLRNVYTCGDQPRHM